MERSGTAQACNGIALLFNMGGLNAAISGRKICAIFCVQRSHSNWINWRRLNWSQEVKVALTLLVLIIFLFCFYNKLVVGSPYFYRSLNWTRILDSLSVRSLQISISFNSLENKVRLKS